MHLILLTRPSLHLPLYLLWLTSPSLLSSNHFSIPHPPSVIRHTYPTVPFFLPHHLFASSHPPHSPYLALHFHTQLHLHTASHPSLLCSPLITPAHFSRATPTPLSLPYPPFFTHPIFLICQPTFFSPHSPPI